MADGVSSNPAGLPEFYADDVVNGNSSLPRYQMPNITSILPEYTNAEQDNIMRAFGNANYDAIAKLPAHLRTHEINKMRAQIMEQARQPNAPPAGKATSAHGLFQEFEYIPSRHSLADEIASQERLYNEQKRLEVGAGKEFAPAGNHHKGKHQDGFVEGAGQPYSVDPYEAGQDLILRNKYWEDAQILAGPFVPAGSDKSISGPPTRLHTRDMINNLTRVIKEDWEYVDISVYANEDDNWVFRFNLESVESEDGLTAYMNVFVRCNEYILKYQLAKVLEQWNVKPGDGYCYFTFRPPWIKNKSQETTYKAHPELALYSGV